MTPLRSQHQLMSPAQSGTVSLADAAPKGGVCLLPLQLGEGPGAVPRRQA
jgi:hypothetical protein